MDTNWIMKQEWVAFANNLEMARKQIIIILGVYFVVVILLDLMDFFVILIGQGHVWVSPPPNLPS